MAANSHDLPGSDTGLPRDVVEDILSSVRRRALLSCLADHEGGMVLEDLAAAVGARERGTSPDAIDAETLRAVRDDIYERHLPKLTATDVVEYDSMRGTVRLDNRAVARELDR